jgi:hypothetical protein
MRDTDSSGEARARFTVNNDAAETPRNKGTDVAGSRSVR